MKDTDGNKFIKSYKIGEDIFYHGKGIFRFYTHDFGFGNIFPGTIFREQAYEISVSEEAVEIDVEQVGIGILFFIVPGPERLTLNYTFPRK